MSPLPQQTARDLSLAAAPSVRSAFDRLRDVDQADERTFTCEDMNALDPQLDDVIAILRSPPSEVWRGFAIGSLAMSIRRTDRPHPHAAELTEAHRLVDAECSRLGDEIANSLLEGRDLMHWEKRFAALTPEGCSRSELLDLLEGAPSDAAAGFILASIAAQHDQDRHIALLSSDAQRTQGEGTEKH